jgi:hypothetical protein
MVKRAKDYLDAEPTRTLFWVELVCAGCSATTEGGWTAGRVPIKEMKAEATKDGWSFGGVHSFCTDNCRSGFIEKNQPKSDSENGDGHATTR